MITPFKIAQRFVGEKEVEGTTANPVILRMLQLDNTWPSDDSVPWCAGFCNYIFWLCWLPRSKSLRARSWLAIGETVEIYDAAIGFDVVILKRGGGNQPGADVIDAPGHVGFFAGFNNGKVLILAGNQNDEVNITAFDIDLILGIRRVS